MCPVLSLGGAEVHAYALFTWLGALAACLLALPALKRTGLSAVRCLFLLLSMCVSFLIGARLWNLAVNPGNFLVMKWYALKLAGLSLYGGLAGAMLAMAAYLKALRLKLLPVLDAMTFPCGAAFCVARIGCFLNGCCGGVATNGPLGVVFPKEHLAESLPGILSFISNRPVHPTQLYELFGAALGIAAVAAVNRKRGGIPGMRFLCYAGVFSLMRLLVLPLRALAYPAAIKNIFYPCLYLCIIVLSIVGICILKGHSRAETDESCGNT